MKIPARAFASAHSLQASLPFQHARPSVLRMNAEIPNDSSGNNNLGQRFGSAAATAALGLSLTVAAPPAAEAATPVPIPYSVLLKEINDQQVEQLSFSADEKTVQLRTIDGATQSANVLPTSSGSLVDLLLKNDVPFKAAFPAEPDVLPVIFSTLLNLALPLFLLFFFLGNRGGMGGMGGGMGGGNNPFEMGKSKAELEMEPNTGVKFDDVAGCDGSKLELREVVDFLKNPGKYEAVGARAPRGVLMEGPPGTGKTLLARAVAGEAGVPFISASGSEFVEMFVGVGASRVRDIFTKAKKNAPCIIFIDEIDAVAKRRAGGAGGGRSGVGNDEQEQTLNQILTEMDGFGGVSGVVVIAATNRADVLDQALLRPGRFDRRVPVDLPDREGRLAILKVHARSKPLDGSVDLGVVAARTTGFSGASLANLLNEAAIVTARRDKDEVSISEIEYALDRLQVGLEKRTGMSNQKRQELVAYHEAGHALIGVLEDGYDEVGKVTIVPRTNGAGGFTLFMPSDEMQDSGMYPRKYLEARLRVALGGRVAEEVIYGAKEITTGASNDLQVVADLARRMVTQWGFAGDELSYTAWESPDGSGMMMPKMASEETQEKVDAQVEKLVNKAYASCKAMMVENRAVLDAIKDALIDEETIDKDRLLEIVGPKAGTGATVVA